MPTEAKKETVAELQAALAGSRTLIVSEYRGLTVKEIAEIRRALRKQDVAYRVIKNRLMKIAAKDTIGEALAPFLTGPTAIAFGDDESSTAKAVIEATRAYRVVTITGGVLGDRAITADGVKALAALPSREVLLAGAIGAVIAAPTQTATLLQAPMAQTARLVAAFIESRGSDGAEPVPAA